MPNGVDDNKRGPEDELKEAKPKPEIPLPDEVQEVHDQLEAMEVLPTSREILGVSVEFTNKGKKSQIGQVNGKIILTVNIKKFPSPEDAVYQSGKMACYLAERRKILEGKDNKKIKEISEKPNLSKRVLELRGLKRLKLWRQEDAEALAENIPTTLTYGQQFDYACEYYLLTGEYPEGLPENVKAALEAMPKEDEQTPVDFASQSKRNLRVAKEIYMNHVHAQKNLLIQTDQELRKTESDDYVPPPFSGEMEPLDPEKVPFIVSPFIGGYYRGEVFRYNPQTLKLEAYSTTKSPFYPTDLPDDLDELTQYTFEGVWPNSFREGKEPILPLPVRKEEQAFPLPASLEPRDKFTIMRSRHGVFSIEPKGEVPDGTAFSFKFVMCKTKDNKINDEPIQQDTERFTGTIDETTRETVEKVQSNYFLNQPDRARAIASATRMRFTYPENEQMPEMNERYGTAGANLFPAMDEHGLADCHWGNNHAMLAGHQLDIPWRVIHGYHISKHPDVEFAPIGGIGHEWSEIWDDSAHDFEDHEWMKLNATPQKDQDEEDKKDEDLGDIEVEESGILDLSEEEIDKVMEEVTDTDREPYDVATALFKKRTEVDPNKWAEVEKFIKEVNAIRIPEEDRIPEIPDLRGELRDVITAPIGTLEREWQKLFALICEHRTVPKKAFRGPVPRSEGEYIDDFVTAVIGAIANDPDPVDSKVSATRKAEVLDVKEFEEDVIIDLTSSMDEIDSFGNVMKIEQKKLVLSMLYQLMKLNDKLNDSRTQKKLRETLQINSTVYSIRGSGRNDQGIWSLLKTGKETITEQLLCRLADELDKTTPGSGDLLSALRAYKESITEETKQKLKSGKFVKMLTIYTDGNMYCVSCGEEGCGVEMHITQIDATRKEIAELRAMGIIVQGIGFTKKARSIKLICGNEDDPEAAVCPDDASKAVVARQKMLVKCLKRL